MQLSSDFPALTVEHARELDPWALSTVQVHRMVRELRQAADPAQVRLAFAGNVVFDPLPEFVEAHLACHGMTSRSYAAPFGQGLQGVLTPGSALQRFAPNFIFLHFELQALLPGLLEQIGDSADSHERCVAEILRSIEPAVRSALACTEAVILLSNFPGPDCYELGIADPRSDFGEQEFFARLNSRLARSFRAEPRVQIVDLCRLTAIHGRSRARDRRLYYMAKLPWHQSFLPVIADELVRHIGAALGRIRKCLVLDLDNTLWGGVLGEDGPHGVRVGMGDPVSEAHLDLQRRIRALKRRGILLAVCSKNNPADVDEVFRVRTDMPLRREDFVCMQVSWEPKHEGLRRIATQLNIGTDSLVLLDDSPAEIELVRQMLPEVECVRVPDRPELRPCCLDRVHGLDRVVITTEDVTRSDQYRQNSARETSRAMFDDLRGYLLSLQTRITIRPLGAQTLTRAHQLLGKTNQFNLTNLRPSLGELQSRVRDQSCRVLAVRAQDRFGDLGWIGVVLLAGLSGREARIENFVLSCRAMGRAIESAVLNQVKHACFADWQCQSLIAEFRPSAKNAPVSELYEEHGFRLLDTDASGTKRYRLERGDSTATPCEWIAVDAS